MSKVTLLFLFAQGILAGMGLLHILIMVSMESWENFRKTHGKMVMLMFNIFHTLTFDIVFVIISVNSSSNFSNIFFSVNFLISYDVNGFFLLLFFNFISL